jgi:hypothetical protein
MQPCHAILRLKSMETFYVLLCDIYKEVSRMLSITGFESIFFHQQFLLIYNQCIIIV